MKLYRFKEMIDETTYAARLEVNEDSKWKSIRPYTVNIEAELTKISSDEEWTYFSPKGQEQRVEEVVAISRVEDETTEPKKNFMDKCKGFFGATE